jgi:hypothetical protein
MWRHISGVKQPQKNSAKAKYEEKRDRNFLEKWKVGRSWLIHSEEKGMQCLWCMENEDSISSQSKQFIEGTSTYKLDSVKHHENSNAHIKAKELVDADGNREDTAASKAMLMLKKDTADKMALLFRNIHALVKNRKSLRDFGWLCELDTIKGLNIGRTYLNTKAASQFTGYIAQAERNRIAREMEKCKFFSVTCDGSTDASIKEQEIVYAKYCFQGQVVTQFLGIESPQRADAPGVTAAIKTVLSSVGIDESVMGKKLVSLGCDGAAVMVGTKGGVGTLLKGIQPSMITVHCLAHRLELAYRDAVKKCSLYNSMITLLMGLYYLYHNSPLQRNCLKSAFTALKQKPTMPTRVGGTRWVGHLLSAIENYQKAKEAIAYHLESLKDDKSFKGDARAKATGYLRLMKRKDVRGFMHHLQDILSPLKTLSLTLQARDTTLADVEEKLQMATDLLEDLRVEDGPNFQQFKDENTVEGKPANNIAAAKAAVVQGLLNSFEKRFSELKYGEGVAGATRIANLKSWPRSDNREERRTFGTEEIETISAHFQNILEGNDISIQKIKQEWPMLKSNLYIRYGPNLHTTPWQVILSQYVDEYPNIMALFELILIVPASSAENERGFSAMKLTKTAERNRTDNTTLTNLLTIQLSTPSISSYDPGKALECWLYSTTGKSKRRPEHMEKQAMKKPKITETDSVPIYEEDEHFETIEEEEDEEDKEDEEVGEEEEEDEQDFDYELNEEEVALGLKL